MKTGSLFFNNINLDIIKILALLVMTLDHIGHLLYPGCFELRLIGRATFPLFVFLLTFHLAQQGIFLKYIKRMFPFAILATLMMSPFDIVIRHSYKLNIFWSFLVAIVFLFLVNKIKEDNMPKFFKIFLWFMLWLIFSALSFLCDYQFGGFLLIVAMYAWFKTRKPFFMVALLFSALYVNSDHLMTYPSVVIPFMLMSLLTILFGLSLEKRVDKSQKRWLKPWWIFYAYYPVHVMVLYIIRICFY